MRSTPRPEPSSLISAERNRRDREHREQLLEITHIIQKGVWRGDTSHAIAQTVWDELHGRVIPDGREGMVSVFDCDGVYAGCMGVELWRALVNAREAIDA